MESRAALEPAVMYCAEHNNATAKMREREREKRTNGRHMRQKTCCNRTSVVWCKTLKNCL